MPTCAKCDSPFPNVVEIDGKPRNLQRRKHCLVCSPFGARNTRKLGAAGDGRGSYSYTDWEGDTKSCSKCGTTKPVSEFYLYGKGPKKGKPHSWCKQCLRDGVKDAQRKLKAEAIAYKGGVCADCGEMPHPAAMAFHHRDPGAKDFSIARARTRTLAAVRGELDKCDLLCHNCHAIRHAEYGG